MSTKTRLADLLNALRGCKGFLGANVTVPHKVAVMDFLDSIDAGARRIHAVNTIVRDPRWQTHRLQHRRRRLRRQRPERQPDRPASFTPSLKGMNVLILGAGGSARAVAFHVADEMAGGKLLICNRTTEHAASLASRNSKGRKRRELAISARKNCFRGRLEPALSSTAPPKARAACAESPNGTATLPRTLLRLGARSSADVRSTRISIEPASKSNGAEPPSEDIESNNQASMNLAAIHTQRTSAFTI